jgi:hypothetical protein
MAKCGCDVVEMWLCKDLAERWLIHKVRKNLTYEVLICVELSNPILLDFMNISKCSGISEIFPPV